MKNAMENIKKKLSTIQWEDSSIDEISSNYESVSLRILESSGRNVFIRFVSHIALHWSGHWDENVIESCSLSIESQNITDALQIIKMAYGNNPTPGGGNKNITGPWFDVSIKMIDGCSTISIIFQDIEM